MPVLQEMHEVLIRITYPATKEQIIDQALNIGVPEWVIECLRTLPEHTYGSTNTVMDALDRME